MEQILKICLWMIGCAIIIIVGIYFENNITKPHIFIQISHTLLVMAIVYTLVCFFIIHEKLISYLFETWILKTIILAFSSAIVFFASQSSYFMIFKQVGNSATHFVYTFTLLTFLFASAIWLLVAGVISLIIFLFLLPGVMIYEAGKSEEELHCSNKILKAIQGDNTSMEPTIGESVREIIGRVVAPILMIFCGWIISNYASNDSRVGNLLYNLDYFHNSSCIENLPSTAKVAVLDKNTVSVVVKQGDKYTFKTEQCEKERIID